MIDFTYQELDDLDSACTDSLTLCAGAHNAEFDSLDPRYTKRIKALRKKIQTRMHSEGSAA